MEYLSRLGPNLQVSIAAAAAIVAGISTLALFACTLLLRASTLAAGRRRRAVVRRWRRIFAEALASRSAAETMRLPRRARRDSLYLLDEWNRFRASIEGEAAENLTIVANRLGLGKVAAALLHKHALSSRLLGIRALGHLGDRSHRADFVALLDEPSTALSVTAAAALVDIDALEAAPLVMPRVIRRADWPPPAVAQILKAAGPALVTQPLCNAILTADAPTATRLLSYAELLRPENLEQLVELIVRERTEPEILAAALKAVGSHGDIPGLGGLARHGTWYVRMQAARLLGRVGRERDLPQLEQLLADKEWWVRYRAAQAIVALPFLGPRALRALAARQTDRYAADMMQHAMAEAGL